MSLTLLCPCLSTFFLSPSAAAHLLDKTYLINGVNGEGDFEFQRLRHGLFSGGSFEAIKLKVEVNVKSGQIIALNLLPLTSGKGRRITLLDIGSVTLKPGTNTIVIKGRNGGDMLFEGFSNIRKGEGEDSDGGEGVGLRGENISVTLERVLNHVLSRNKTSTNNGSGAGDGENGGKKSSTLDSMKNFGREQADKAKHFAMREKDLADKKKLAEERKSKYMKDVGGMKYTAMAMSKM